jgi:purine-binding chemotaxis protein CheW
METNESSQLGQYLTFFLDTDEYGLEIRSIREIVEYQPITRVPGSPFFLKGVMNLRGSVVPVIDLALVLGLPERAPGRRTCIIVLDAEMGEQSTVIGLMVDAVRQVTEIKGAQIEPVPSFGTRVQTDFIQGMGRIEDKFVLLLQLARLLEAAEGQSAIAAAATEIPDDSDVNATESPVSPLPAASAELEESVA